MSTATNATVPAAVRRKAVVAAALGNFIEWFEFTLYGFFAATIAMNFFPTGQGAPSLLATFAAFSVPFVARPLGSLVFGHFGDRMGRRTTLSVAILGMSVATFVIGALPSHDSIGTTAPVLLVIARVTQGFSAGGEFGGATAFLVEYAPENRRTFYGSWQMSTQFLAGFVAAVVGTALSTALSVEALNAWGWRLPFLLTLPLGVIGLYLRLRLDETPQFERAAQQDSEHESPLLHVMREHRGGMLRVVGLLITGTTCLYMIQAFWPAFLVQELGMPQSRMFTAMLLGIAVQVALTPAWALLADRIGRRKPFLVASPIALMLCAVPIHLLLLQGTFRTTIAAYVLLALAASPMTGSLATAMTEVFPVRVRYSGMSVAHSVAVSIFGGFTPLVLTSLIRATGSTMSPAYYLAGTALISAVAAASFGETGTRAETSETTRARDAPDVPAP